MQGSEEGKRGELWGPCAHFRANISMKIVGPGKEGGGVFRMGEESPSPSNSNPV